MGFEVCDADRVAHGLMEKGTPVYRQVVARFGERILLADGEISRSILGKTVFENPEERDALNALVHPAVRGKLAGWIAEKRNMGKDAAVQVPLLFESGMETLDRDAILCVSSSEELVFQRLEKRGLTRSEAALRIASQMPQEEKEQRSDQVVPNLGTLGELEESIRDAVTRVKAKGRL